MVSKHYMSDCDILIYCVLWYICTEHILIRLLYAFETASLPHCSMLTFMVSLQYRGCGIDSNHHINQLFYSECYHFLIQSRNVDLNRSNTKEHNDETAVIHAYVFWRRLFLAITRTNVPNTGFNKYR